MTPIDTRLYELFARKDVMTLPWEMKQEPPELHDVFRVAKEKFYWWNTNDWDLCITFYYENRNLPPIKWYNPTLSLMNQEDSTKQAIVDLFSN